MIGMQESSTWLVHGPANNSGVQQRLVLIKNTAWPLKRKHKGATGGFKTLPTALRDHQDHGMTSSDSRAEEQLLQILEHLQCMRAVKLLFLLPLLLLLLLKLYAIAPAAVAAPAVADAASYCHLLTPLLWLHEALLPLLLLLFQMVCCCSRCCGSICSICCCCCCLLLWLWV